MIIYNKFAPSYHIKNIRRLKEYNLEIQYNILIQSIKKTYIKKLTNFSKK